LRHLRALILIAIIASACTPSTTDDTSTTTTLESVAGTIDAPDFPEGLDWINTAAPISLTDLKGKVVLLDFWTYGCINCIHIIPDLERLEAEFEDELVVIGVHSAKFTNEGETDNLRNIVQRYDITHPVVNDRDFEIWRTWGANAWPTIAIIDPDGRAVGVRAGEGVYDAVQPVIAALVNEFDASGSIDRTPFTPALEADFAPDRPLRFPGKVTVYDGTLYIADTGHHRIVVADAETGEVAAVYGSGRRGFEDGTALEASFNAPQGLSMLGTTLFVADTNNHAIRAVDTRSGDVTTVLGTGRQGWPPAAGPFAEVELSNPWAITHHEGFLYIANAGTHQIWAADLARGIAAPLIGNANESTLNGDFDFAELAQPSGLTLSYDGQLLYFADSESSSIRVADLVGGFTELVAGGASSLFDFGDEDGTGDEARLQHPLGVAFGGDVLYVADTYNSKIKQIDLSTNTVTTWLGDEGGWVDGDAPLFNEPGGLALDGTTLYVADTNNHVIRAIDTDTGGTRTVVLKGIEKFAPPAAWRGGVVMLQPISLPDGAANLVLKYSLPAGYKVNKDAPSSVTISAGSDLVSFVSGDTLDITGTSLPLTVRVETTSGSGEIRFDVTLIYCEAVAESLCLIDQVRFIQPVDLGAAGASAIVLQRLIPTPEF